MRLADVRALVPQFLHEKFDCNLPIILGRITGLEEQVRSLFDGQADQLPIAIKSAHDVCGSLGVFGLVELSLLAQEVERLLRSGDYDDAPRQAAIWNDLHNLRSFLM